MLAWTDDFFAPGHRRVCGREWQLPRTVIGQRPEMDPERANEELSAMSDQALLE